MRGQVQDGVGTGRGQCRVRGAGKDRAGTEPGPGVQILAPRGVENVGLQLAQVQATKLTQGANHAVSSCNGLKGRKRHPLNSVPCGGDRKVYKYMSGRKLRKKIKPSRT